MWILGQRKISTEIRVRTTQLVLIWDWDALIHGRDNHTIRGRMKQGVLRMWPA